jgi:L-rhamnose mutarotase
MAMIKFCCILIFTTLFFIACSDRGNTAAPVQRFGMVTGLKAEKMDYYKELHAAVWPSVQLKIKECNIQNYSIFLKEINDSLMLFSYFEYAGNDFDADMKKMAADSATQRWWKETDPCQQPLPDAASKGQIWSSMEEVFHQN